MLEWETSRIVPIKPFSQKSQKFLCKSKEINGFVLLFLRWIPRLTFQLPPSVPRPDTTFTQNPDPNPDTPPTMAPVFRGGEITNSTKTTTSSNPADCRSTASPLVSPCKNSNKLTYDVLGKRTPRLQLILHFCHKSNRPSLQTWSSRLRTKRSTPTPICSVSIRLWLANLRSVNAGSNPLAKKSKRLKISIVGSKSQ